jgi:hypothetical protein
MIGFQKVVKKRLLFSFLILKALKTLRLRNRKAMMPANKKVSGIKRHIAVDTGGRPHMIYITTADTTDREGAIEGIKNSSSFFPNVVNVLVDGAWVTILPIPLSNLLVLKLKLLKGMNFILLK